MSIRDEYMKERRRLQKRNSYYKKKHGKPIYKIPSIPKRITKGSVRRLTKLLSKSETVRAFNKSIGLTPTGKLKKSTKNKIRKKLGLQSIPKQTRKKKNKYLPKEESVIINNVSPILYDVNSIDSLLGDMYLSSKRGNNTHRANVYDLSQMLRRKFEQACFQDGESVVTQRLQENSATVEEAIQAIEGYYSDSNEEQLKEAIDKIEELISIITGEPVTEKDAKTLEDLYSDTMSFYDIIEDGQEFTSIKVDDNTRLIIDPETGELLNKIIV